MHVSSDPSFTERQIHRTLYQMPGQSSLMNCYFFLPFPLLALPFVDATLTAREVVVDVPLLPGPLFTAVICLFYARRVSGLLG
jgi:hypothetical protein